MKRKDELTDAIEKFLIEKDPKFLVTKTDIRKWVDENYDIIDGELKIKNIQSNTLSFFYF